MQRMGIFCAEKFCILSDLNKTSTRQLILIFNISPCFPLVNEATLRSFARNWAKNVF